ncbi:malonate--CoA ligase [Ferruginivarius sediminum]|uniref:Malonyl-CoA synthase n=1 Tax=Ferruginivarius sediminum TaxID=2661937 RepID=A0A369TA35_9PROT|nr:malonyl-CoA synthase [Ferruginivarius sediminum]RDD62189.1 malonyl-CoA synthase [Ferruginivarius sediminum]
MNDNLFESFRMRFPQDPRAVVMEIPGCRQYRYADLDRDSAMFALRLSDAGANPGDRVMVQVEKSLEAVAVYLACLRAGFVFIPLNTAYGREELEYLTADASPAAVVCDPASHLAAADFPYSAPCGTFTLDCDGLGSLTKGAREVAKDLETVPCRGEDVAAILYTSGTTGRAKGAMLTHANLASNAVALCDCWGLSDSDVLLHALPIFHTHGLFVAINTTLLQGGQMLFLPRFDVEQVLSVLPRVTVMMGVPTYYTRLLNDARFDKWACRSIRLFISGSAPLLPETFEEFRRRTGHAILERYGMTETNMIASNPVDGDRTAGSVGYPLPGVAVRICGEDGTALADGQIGNIEVRGPSVFKGYWRNPEKTNAEFCEDGFFKTGDVGRFDSNGYLHIVGRSKDLIISGGFNVYPKEVEEVVDRIDGVGESAVIGVSHPDFGEGVVAVVVPDRTRAGELTVGEVIAEARSRLAAFKTPKAVVFVEELPKNAMGKIEKAKLRSAYNDLFSTVGGQ